jgi:hypothetical protein
VLVVVVVMAVVVVVTVVVLMCGHGGSLADRNGISYAKDGRLSRARYIAAVSIAA